VRPRGWHLPERHVRVDREDASASLVDFGLFFFHNAKDLVARGTGPYFYLPKMESHLEARLWNDVFAFAEDALGVRRGTTKGTALIETFRPRSRWRRSSSSYATTRRASMPGDGTISSASSRRCEGGRISYCRIERSSR